MPRRRTVEVCSVAMELAVASDGVVCSQSIVAVDVRDLSLLHRSHAVSLLHHHQVVAVAVITVVAAAVEVCLHGFVPSTPPRKLLVLPRRAAVALLSQNHAAPLQHQ